MAQRLRARGSVFPRGVVAVGPQEPSHAHERLRQLLRAPKVDPVRTMHDALAVADACAEDTLCIDAFIAFRIAHHANPADPDVHACYWRIRASFPATSRADFDRSYEMITRGASPSTPAHPRPTNVQSLLPRLARRRP